MKAVVENNKAYCPRCGERDYKVTDVKEAKDGAVKYTVRCKCGTEFDYCKTLKIGQEKVFTEFEGNKDLLKGEVAKMNKGENNAETVTISKEKYEELLEDSQKLNALECAGVDNWEGYGYAMELMEEE